MPFESTGLEQALNAGATGGTLAVPEIVPLARHMAAEGIVLLRNDNAALPVRKGERVAVFGRCAVDYFCVGYGSGGDIIPPYKANLMQGLEELGVAVEPTLAARYAEWCALPDNAPKACEWGQWPMNYAEMPIDDEAVRAAAANSDLAVVVIGRAAGEDRENLLEKGSYYLTDEEHALLRQVTEAFERVCVALDCGNVIDLSWVNQYRISALVYAWQGGMESGRALADVLTGRVNPCAKLTDTIAARYDSYPSSANFGNREANHYAEDVYVGYRYFETFHPEQVMYPFGFGLSYTTFAMDASAEREGDAVRVTARVTNTGDTAGKEVVQVYAGFPCGKLGNPRKVLVGFAKTDLLAPGEAQTLEIRVNLRDFAPYDDSGVTGFASCHVWEAGDYRVEVGTSIRDTREALCFHRDAAEVVRQLSEQAAPSPLHPFQRMVNRDGALVYEDVPTSLKDKRAEVLSSLPAPLAPVSDKVSFADVLNGSRTPEAFVAQLSPQELDDLTHGQGHMDSCYGAPGNAGAFGGVTEQLRARGLPAIITTDGPSGIRIRLTTSLLPCGTALASSFNPEGVERLYAVIGREMRHHGSDMLLAPGMNIHRDPLCGRNFEYYSEDPFLTAKLASACVRGLQGAGVSACPKHFACNNQERNRNRHDSRVSERALREIYLKGFELMIREAKPLCLMSSYNKVNGEWSHYHYELATAILRGEWGYEGLVITDWWMQEGTSPVFPSLRNDPYRIRAQVDVVMPGDLKWLVKGERLLPSSLEAPDGVTLGEAQRSALNVARFIVALLRRRNAE